MGRFASLVLLLALAVPPAVDAEIKTMVRADGTLVVYNTGEAPAGRVAARRPLRLLPVPDAGWEQHIRENAVRQRLEPRLVQAVIQVESAYNPRAVSRKGAQGLMQLMPGTAREVGVGDVFDPGENIRGGTLYLRRMMDRFENRLELALAAYNAGPGAVERHGGIPPYRETRDYVTRVLTVYQGRPPALPPATSVEARPVFVQRDAGNRLVVTTSLGRN